jgi:hypothetical protein
LEEEVEGTEVDETGSVLWQWELEIRARITQSV